MVFFGKQQRRLVSALLQAVAVTQPMCHRCQDDRCDQQSPLKALRRAAIVVMVRVTLQSIVVSETMG